MATMVKGKDREKKKTKHKNINKTSLTDEAQSKISQNINEYECTSQPRIGTEPLVDETSENTKASNENNEHILCTENVITVSTEESSNFDTGECKDPKTDLTIAPAPILHDLSLENTSNVGLLRDNQTSSDKVSMGETNAELEMMTIKAAEIKMRELELYKQNAQLMSSDKVSESQKTNSEEICSKTRNAETVSEPEDIIPSAPMFEEEPQQQASYQQLTKELRQKPKCMPLEEAVAIYGGNEMAAVKAMSEKEELIVEAGPVSGPEHPLVDLLSTFRSSLRALDNERSKLICGVADEQNSRSLLWKIEKRNINREIECKCGTKVALNAKYEHATFLKEKLPVAKLRLEGLLRDIQDSYCHHQHSALLAHCQIEELISETVESNKPAIREALSLVLQALRVSEGQLQAAALRRWAAALVAALVDQRDVRQILFVLHHLFRESRSVAWAGRVLQPGAGTASTLAVLDTLLSGAKRDTATECTEDMEEAWEEVSASGGGGAVAEDSLRERDLLTLFQVFPLRDIVARIVMFTHSDIRKATEQEWGDRSGGVEVMKACCGVRTLLSTCERAARAHAQYSRLLARLRRLVAAALRALVCLYRSPRAPYKQELQDKMAAELEACFTAGFVLFDVHDLHKLTTALLSEDTAKDYCLAFIVGLHDKSPKKIESLSVDAPVLPCNERVRIVTYASVHREYDHELATIVMDFLFQIGVRNKSPVCSGGCSTEARRSLPVLLKSHHYLRTTALYTLADIDKESVDPSIISVLDVQSWRPQPEELSSVLNEWARRCPALLVELLTRLDCTPFTGLSHPAQLLLSHFIVKWSGPVEARWRALRNVRTHAVWWAMTSPVAHAPDKQPDDLFEHAHALLATEWGHSIPLICNYGVSSLLALSVRPREAVHCLAPIMLVMAHSPESISLTPKFAEIFSALLNSGPSLVQRALGRGGVSGCDLLLRLALSQIENEPCVGQSVSNTVSAWLHALSTSGQAVLDTVAAAARQWTAIDAHAAYLVQDQNAKDHVASAVRNASVAPLVCECLLRAYHTQHEFNTRMFGSVANVLYHQQINGQKIHVDNALQKINSAASSEELVIYRTASAVLVAPLHHPAHLTLWRLFMHLYLQRPPDNMHEVAIPVGPLFFSGLKKSRTLAQLKKRLQETVAYHNNEIEIYKKMNIDESKPQSSDRVVKSESITIEKGLLPELTIKDLTGESETESDLDSSSDEEVKEIMDNTGDNVGDKEKKRILDMACYHTAAERMMREYISWLEEGDRVRASPHHADIARFIPEQALEAAWQSYVSRVRPPPSPELDTSPRPLPPPNVPPPCDDSPLKQAIDAIMGIKDLSGIRSRRQIKSPLGEVQFKDSRRLLAVVDQHLNDLDKLAKEWCSEVSHISSLDSRLWELTGSLRVPRPLPPVTKPCPNTERKCKTVTFYFQEREWCISVGAERGIQENRSSWRSAIRRVSRPRPLAARAAASLHSIARGVSEGGTAVCAVERAFSRALSACPAALAARAAFIDLLAQRWICSNGRVCAELLSRWSRSSEGPQQALCGALVCPHRAPHDHWPLIYNALLDITSASMLFSYLSKFDMAAWSKTASLKSRQDFLSILLSANVKYGPVPSNHELIVLELVGVHTRTLVNSEVMCGFVMRFNTVSCDSVVPVEQWKHLVKAVEAAAQDVPFDQLDHLLQELGALWWTRILDSNRSTVVPVAAYAPHVAALLRELLRALVDAAVNLSYHPERVGKVAWASAERSWGGWVRPHPAPPPPLLPPEMYTHMLQLFRDCILMIMERCVGSEASVLRQVFTWCTEVYAHAQAQSQSRVRASEMLATLASLPWQHHWLDTACLERVVQISCTTDREIQSWCSGVLRHTRAETLCDVTGDALPARLATLLHLFTATPLNHHSELLEQATRLPWSELPEQALDSALDRFFALQYNCTVPYHLLPQFCVVVHASELRCHPDGVTSRRHSVGVTSRSRSKRAAAVSQWTRAACSPHMHAHVALFSADLLDIISQLAPHLDNTSGELEELLCRASVVMCIEPAASVALPVWVSHMRTACGAVSAASVSAAAALTAPPHAAALADAALKRHLLLNESGWSEAVSRWKSNSPWTEPQMFVSHACVYAAYACALAQPQNAHARETLIALMDCKINFIEEEVMVAVWICYACRASVTCACTDTSAGARTLLCAWAVRTRRSLLRAVTMQPDTACTTARHRLLCRLAECILTPSKEAEINYKTALTALGLNMNDVIDWGKIPQPKLLPRLAVRLYPKYERYFRVELDEAPESNLI